MIKQTPNLKKIDENQIIDDGIDCEAFVEAADCLAEYLDNLSKDDYNQLKYGVRKHERN